MVATTRVRAVLIRKQVPILSARLGGMKRNDRDRERALRGARQRSARNRDLLGGLLASDRAPGRGVATGIGIVSALSHVRANVKTKIVTDEMQKIAMGAGMDETVTAEVHHVRDVVSLRYQVIHLQSTVRPWSAMSCF